MMFGAKRTGTLYTLTEVQTGFSLYGSKTKKEIIDELTNSSDMLIKMYNDVENNKKLEDVKSKVRETRRLIANMYRETPTIYNNMLAVIRDKGQLSKSGFDSFCEESENKKSGN